MKRNTDQSLVNELVQFRRHLHKYPELSGDEKYTPQLILDFIGDRSSFDMLTHLGGNGMAIIYDSGNAGDTTVFRCETDALPIQESNDFDYKSVKPGISHKCGHDGHMAIVTGLAKLLNKQGPKKGKVVLLYQPAEETGTGAEAILGDERFTSLQPDNMYALHNVPQLEKGEIFLKEGSFSAASRGIIIKLLGATSHAAEPENGKNPAMALSEIIREVMLLPYQKDFKSLTLVTVVHALLGEIAFGVSPGYAEVRATLRAYQETDMANLVKEVEACVHKICDKEGLKYAIDYTEIFPETANNEDAIAVIKNCAENARIPARLLPQPFKWSEDFGHFLLRYKGAMVALGAGTTTPKLHNHNYDFPDELIPVGLDLFHTIFLYHHH